MLLKVLTKATGIKQLIDYINDNKEGRVEVDDSGKLVWEDGIDCGCDKRKAKLNKIRFKFNAVRCLTEEQYNKWHKFVNKENQNEITYEEQVDVIIPIYAHLFARQLKPMSCCLEPYINDINKVFNQYN